MCQIFVCEMSTDSDSVLLWNAVNFTKGEQELGEAFGNRTGTQHLYERGETFTFENQRLNHANGKTWNFFHQVPKIPSVQKDNLGLRDSHTGPHVHAAAKHFGATHKVARLPVSQGNLPAGGGRIKDPDQSGLDEINPLVKIALAKQNFLGLEPLLMGPAQDQFQVTFIKVGEDVGLTRSNPSRFKFTSRPH